jgi:hypothetical protein
MTSCLLKRQRPVWDVSTRSQVSPVDETEAGYGVSKHVVDVGGQSAIGLGAMGLEGDGLNAVSSGNFM